MHQHSPNCTSSHRHSSASNLGEGATASPCLDRVFTGEKSKPYRARDSQATPTPAQRKPFSPLTLRKHRPQNASFSPVKTAWRHKRHGRYSTACLLIIARSNHDVQESLPSLAQTRQTKDRSHADTTRTDIVKIVVIVRQKDI